ncbi:MAG: cation transporter [Deltaproteobacteria bacterium]|nr:cation transporter [Deltaproteobacteria bacterium]
MKSGAEHTHCAHGVDTEIKGRLKVSAALTAVIFIVELVGGYLFNSLALISDAAHVFMDVLALSLSWFALYISELPPTEKRTYGLHRVEVFVSFINSSVLILLTAFIFYKAYQRLMAPQEVESVGMLTVAVVGLVVNLVVAFWLMRYAHSDLNVKSAYLHVVGDAVASVGVIAGGVVIYFTGWYAVDPLISFAIGAIIMAGSCNIMKESAHILLEGVPRDIDLNAVVEDMKAVAGVGGVHSLHVWSICHSVYALSAHVDIEPLQRPRMGEIFSGINEALAQNHHIFYTTLQAECSGCDQNDIFRKIAHKERNHNHLH